MLIFHLSNAQRCRIMTFSMQANKILKLFLILLISVIIGLSTWLSITEPHIGGFLAALILVCVGTVIAFLWSLPVILVIATIYRLLKGFN
jgi:hypothetical protein